MFRFIKNLFKKKPKTYILFEIKENGDVLISVNWDKYLGNYDMANMARNMGLMLYLLQTTQLRKAIELSLGNFGAQNECLDVSDGIKSIVNINIDNFFKYVNDHALKQRNKINDEPVIQPYQVFQGNAKQ